MGVVETEHHLHASRTMPSRYLRPRGPCLGEEDKEAVDRGRLDVEVQKQRAGATTLAASSGTGILGIHL